MNTSLFERRQSQTYCDVGQYRRDICLQPQRVLVRPLSERVLNPHAVCIYNRHTTSVAIVIPLRDRPLLGLRLTDHQQCFPIRHDRVLDRGGFAPVYAASVDLERLEGQMSETRVIFLRHRSKLSVVNCVHPA